MNDRRSAASVPPVFSMESPACPLPGHITWRKGPAWAMGKGEPVAFRPGMDYNVEKYFYEIAMFLVLLREYK